MALAALPVASALAQNETNPRDAEPQGSFAGHARRISINGMAMAAKITYMVAPEYPKKLQDEQVTGTVVLSAVIAKDGSVADLTPVAGPSPLTALATDAVRQWRYQPTVIEGQPVEVSTTISVVFAPGQPPRYQQQGAAAPTTGSAVDPRLKADILHLIDVMHVKDTQVDFGHQMIETLRPTIIAALPPTADQKKIVDELSEKLMASLQSDEATDRMVVVYARYLSDDDVKGISAFYETPAGQRLGAVATRMEDELSQTGEQYAMQNLGLILKGLCNSHPELRGKADFCAKDGTEKKGMLLPPKTGWAGN